MKNKKLKVAVTGNIGSGKSTFCNFLSESGYPVINADNIAKYLLDSDDSLKQNIISAFGKNLYSDNKINRKLFSETIFSNRQNLIKANALIHPAVKKVIAKKIETEYENREMVFVEAALTFEAGSVSFYDFIVLVTSQIQLRMKRKTKDNLLTEAEFLIRDSFQMKEEEKIKKADFVIKNDGTIDELKSKALFLIQLLKSLSPSSA
ncbi:MAG: dephospho-CoA kinase [Ignavibacteriaceae bacterium]|nr:dephospho-CoA kinase [Ignavibacteriaceae bacterium]